MSKDELTQLAFSALGGRLTDLDTSESGAIRFTWQGHRFRVSDSLFVEECDRIFLRSNSIASLMKNLLRTRHALNQQTQGAVLLTVEA